MSDRFVDSFRRSPLWTLTALGACCLFLAGCSSDYLPPSAAGFSPASSNTIVLHAGDSIKVTFPGAPNFDAGGTIRVDGKINIPVAGGEIAAAGLTPSALEKEILRLAGSQLVVKQVSVNVVSSAFEVYLEGAVLRPGKLVADRALTPLEALSEGGIDFQKGDLKAVHVIRRDPQGRLVNYKLNLKNALQGKAAPSFELRPYDIIYVPERFTWF